MKILKSETAMGLWNLSGGSFHKTLEIREGKNLIKAAYKAGIRTFDTAFSYKEASSILSSAMREIGKDDISIISKVMPVPTLRKKAEAELRRLNADCFDVLLIHWPTKEENLIESLEALSELKAEGRAKSIGVSNFPFSLLKRAVKRFPIEYHERPLSLIWSKDWEEEKALGLKTIAYSPLGMGILSGKYKMRDEITDSRVSLPFMKSSITDEILKEIYGKPEKALSWVYSENPWCVVQGFSSPSQLETLSRITELEEEEKEHLSSLSDRLSEEIEADNIFAHSWR